MQCGNLRNVALSFWLIRILDECHCCDYVISTVHVSIVISEDPNACSLMI